MGYFSRMAMDFYDEIREEDCFQSRERNLLMRLEDLKYRLDELNEVYLPRNENRRRLTKEDLMYVLPCDLCSVSEVNKAIQLVENELVEKYGIDFVRMKKGCKEPESNVDNIKVLAA